METKKAKVLATVFQKQFQGKYGLNYVHQIIMDNGDVGQYISKSNPQTKFVIGQEIDYTIETKVNGQYTNVYIKPVNEQKPSGGFNSWQKRSGNESFALSYAKDILIASWTGEQKAPLLKTADMFILADKMYGWLEGKKQQAAPIQTSISIPSSMKEDRNPHEAETEAAQPAVESATGIPF